MVGTTGGIPVDGLAGQDLPVGTAGTKPERGCRGIKDGPGDSCFFGDLDHTLGLAGDTTLDEGLLPSGHGGVGGVESQHDGGVHIAVLDSLDILGRDGTVDRVVDGTVCQADLGHVLACVSQGSRNRRVHQERGLVIDAVEPLEVALEGLAELRDDLDEVGDPGHIREFLAPVPEGFGFRLVDDSLVVIEHDFVFVVED